jgi:hypothetical protein
MRRSLIAFALAGCVVSAPTPADTLPPLPDLGVDSPPPHDAGPLPDTDNDDPDHDGLDNATERMLGTNPNEADSDGDGYPDGVEELAHTDPLDPNSHPPATDFYVVLPYGDPTLHRHLDFTARLGRADVYFLVDTTLSMHVPLDDVRTSLSNVIVPAIQSAIADARMGVGDFRDFPDGVHGSAAGTDPDYPYTNRQSMTTDVAMVQSALNALMIGDGIDLPEATTEALYRTVTGTCADASGGFGAPCFRTASHPIIVLVTDAPFHDGSDPANDYSASPPVPPDAHSWMAMLAALNAQHVQTVGVAIGTRVTVIDTEYDSQPDENALAMATASRAESGSTTVYRCDGGQVSGAVVNGIVDLIGAATQDVSARTVDDPSDSVDATRFIGAITPVSSNRSIDHMDTTTFYGVPGGATVTFDVAFQNAFQMSQPHVQLFHAYIEVFDVASGTTVDRRNVYVVVPDSLGLLT